MRAVRVIAGIRIVSDERMAPNKFALVDADGRGYSYEDGAVVRCIMPPPPPVVRAV